MRKYKLACAGGLWARRRCDFALLALVATLRCRFAVPDLLTAAVYTEPASIDTSIDENPNFALGLAGSPGGNRSAVGRPRAGMLVKRMPLTDIDPEARPRSQRRPFQRGVPPRLNHRPAHEPHRKVPPNLPPPLTLTHLVSFRT